MSTCKQWGYPSPVLASAPLSGNKTKQITSRVFSSCCHFVVFPTLFFCLLCSCTLRQKWNYANTRERCPAQVHRAYTAWACSQPTHLVSVACDGYEPEMVKFRLWMHCPEREICAQGQISCRSSPALKQNIFLDFFVAVQRKERPF